MSSNPSANPEQKTKTNSENLKLFAEEFGDGKSNDSESQTIDDLKAMSSENRKNRNNWIASILAVALWAVLIFTIAYHLITTVNFSQHLLTSDSSVELEKVKTAVTLVDDTAKTLYSFLGTLVTAVTAYYFKTVADEVNRNSS
ncbi:MAG: hypothetical protein QNJ42_05785 [Crocosphaera sp.]|nr:hypothetical protein [Crocosphaera sp.]